jgi:choline dehydrogenase
MNSFDYVIVGAGSAGCVLANRLSAEPSITVCLIEAGPPDYNPLIHIPAGFMKTLLDPSVNWLYDSEPSYWTGGRVIAAPRGKTLGGSSSINGHIYNRGQRLDFDGWAQRGNRGWGYADVLPYFKRTEQRIGEGEDTFRGRGGNMAVTDIDWRHPLCDAFIKGAESIGIPHNKDYNGKIQEGVSYAQRTIHGRRRMSTARGYLRPVMKRKNLTVRTNAHATKILFEDKTAKGIRYSEGGRHGIETDIFARREVILSGGAVNSPHLLQLSGIGSPELLGGLGIDVRHALPGVGENLRDHYAPRFTARVKNSGTINELARGPRLLGEIFKYFIGQKSILGLSPTLVYCFWHSNEAARNADLQFTFTPASYKHGVQSKLDDLPGMTIASWQQRPESIGYIRARNADPFEAPVIQPNYLAEETDRQVLLSGMKLARRLLQTEPLQPYFNGELYPGPDVQSDDELLAAARERGTTTFHLMGTCRMGPESDQTAVVDDTLKVRGLSNLRVVDASVMPTMPSANLNAATMMIGEKAADMILGKPPAEAIFLRT